MAPIFKNFPHAATFSSVGYALTTVLVIIVVIVVNNAIIILAIVVTINRPLLTIAESYITHVERAGQGVRRSQIRKQLQQLVTSLLELADTMAKETFTTCTSLYKISTDRNELLT